MVKHLLLDNDGVLVDTEILAYKALKSVFLTQGIELSIDTYVQNCVKTSHGVYHLLREIGIDENGIMALRNKRDELLTHYLLTEPIIYPFVENYLIGLKEYFQLHIVTSSHREHFLAMHQRTGFLKYFTSITTEEDFQKRKPAPDAYIKAMETIGTQPDECIVFEDSERGINAAVNAGLKCIAIPNELTKLQDFGRAWKIVDSFKDAAKYVINYKLETDTQ